MSGPISVAGDSPTVVTVRLGLVGAPFWAQRCGPWIESALVAVRPLAAVGLRFGLRPIEVSRPDWTGGNQRLALACGTITVIKDSGKPGPKAAPRPRM